MKLKLTVILLLLILPAGGRVYPQGIETGPKEKEIELFLEDVSRLALENSLDVQIAKFDAYIERTSLKKEESIFDTFFNAKFGYEHDKRMQPTTLLGDEEKEHSFSAGLEKKLPIGTTVALDATSRKVRNNTPFASLNPYNEAQAKISIEQPLGKNFFGLSDRSNIKITKLDIENSDLISLDSIENSLYAAQKSYWNFVLKQTNLTIAQDMHDKARELYNIYKYRYSLGTVEEPEFLAIEALVVARQNEVLIAHLDKEAAKNDLIFLLNQGDFTQAITAKDQLSCDVHEVDLYKELRGAIESRRDYKRAKNEIKRNNIDVVVKKNALWPEIDLTASFTRNNLNSERNKAWSDIRDNSNDDVAVSLNFRIPLENRQAQSALKRANLEKRKSLLKLKRVERSVLRELNDKTNQVNTFKNQVELFESTVKIHEKKLIKQIERLKYGRSDADTLIRYEDDLLNARLSLASSFYQYRVSIIELALTKNSLLDQYWKEEL